MHEIRHCVRLIRNPDLFVIYEVMANANGSAELVPIAIAVPENGKLLEALKSVLSPLGALEAMTYYNSATDDIDYVVIDTASDDCFKIHGRQVTSIKARS